MYEDFSKWTYWETPNLGYRYFIFLDRDITLETLGNTLCVL